MQLQHHGVIMSKVLKSCSFFYFCQNLKATMDVTATTPNMEQLVRNTGTDGIRYISVNEYSIKSDATFCRRNFAEVILNIFLFTL